MGHSELSWVLPIPIPCGHCGKEFAQIAARLVDLVEIECPSCGMLLDLDTQEWAAFRNSVKEFSVGKFAPVAQVQKQPKRI